MGSAAVRGVSETSVFDVTAMIELHTFSSRGSFSLEDDLLSSVPVALSKVPAKQLVSPLGNGFYYNGAFSELKAKPLRLSAGIAHHKDIKTNLDRE